MQSQLYSELIIIVLYSIVEELNEYQIRKQEKLAEQKKQDIKKTAKKVFRLAFAILIIAGGIGAAFWYLNRPVNYSDPLGMCIQHQNLQMHIHPRLSIKTKGQEQDIPANIGISPTCMRPIHTHDASGTLHLEFPIKRGVKLGEFFKIWEKEFSSEKILDKQNGPEGQVKMLVNGQPNTEFENYIMKDKDQIEIIF